MAKIQTLKNQDGVIIYPQTHTRAVFDKNGTDLQTVLDGLTDEIGDKQVHYFNLTSTSNKEVAQEAYDDFLAGNFPIVIYDDQYFYSQRGNSIHHVFATPQVRQLNWETFDTLGNSYLLLNISEGQVTSVNFELDGDHAVHFISTLKQETDEAFMPTYNAHPATKAYVDQTIAANLGEGGKVSMEIVPERPETGEAGKIYLVPNGDGTHTEYIYIEGADGAAGTWETIGTTDVDLTNYATKEYAESLANVEIIYFNDFNQTAENNEKATQAFEAYLSGKEVLLNCEGEIYELNSVTDTGYMSFLTRKIGNLGNTYTAGDSSTRTTLSLKQVNIQGLGPGNAEFRGTSTQLIATINYLSPNNDYATPYMPEFDGSPATKKYVDDTIAEALENNGGSATEDVVKFTLSGTESVDELQPIVDAYKAGKIVQIEKVGDDYIYTLERANDRLLSFTRPNVDYKDDEGVVVLGEKSIIIFTNEETGVVEDASLNGGLETATVIDASSYSTAEPFIPTNDNQPTSKKYVDDAIASALTGTGGERAFFTFDKKFHELLNEDLQPVVDAHREGKVVEIHMPIEEERFGFKEGTFTVTYAGENQLILSNDLIMKDNGAGAITLDNESYIIDISNTGEIIMIGAASPKQAFLSTINGSYETMFTPTEGWQPATKQYADDRIADAALDLQEYVNNAIADAMPETGVSFEVTSTRPETGEEGIIYLVPNGDGTHTEYMYINNAWETIGTTEVNLNDYATKDYVDDALADTTLDMQQYTDDAITNNLANYATKTDIANAIDDYPHITLVNALPIEEIEE